MARYSVRSASAKRDHQFFIVSVIFVLPVRDGAGGSRHREERLLHFHALQRRFQVVDVMLKFGEAGVFDRGDAHRFLPGHVGPGAIVSAFQLRVKLLEALPVRAARKWICARLDRAHLEAAHALQSVERPTGGLAEFAVVDDVDARLGLPPHDFGDGFLQALFVGAHVGGSPFSRARTSSRSRGGRIRLPTCVVNIRFVLRFIGSGP